MSEVSTAPAATPLHLWIIGVLALLWNAFGAYDYLMTKTHDEAYMAGFTPEQLEYFYGISAAHTAVWAIGVWGAVVAAILMLLRKKAAEIAYMVSLGALLVSSVFTTINGGWAMMGGTETIVISVVIHVIAVGLWLYARAMRLRGVLR